MAHTEQCRSVIGPRARQKFAKIAAVPRLHLKAIMSFMQYAGAFCGAFLQCFSAALFSSAVLAIWKSKPWQGDNDNKRRAVECTSHLLTIPSIRRAGILLLHMQYALGKAHTQF